MVKYMFCILIGAFFALGISNPSQTNLQESREDTGITKDMQSHAEYSYHVSAVISEYSNRSCQDQTFGNGTSTYKSGNGILGSSLFFRNTLPSKILKFDSNNIVMQVLSSLCFRIPENNRKELSPNTNSIKYLHGYYIYSLRHILI